MINETMYNLGAEPNAIRELFGFGMQRKAVVGAENVFDYSIGNPSVPAPEKVRSTIIELAQGDPVKLHEYTPAQGDPEVRRTVADYIRATFDVPAEANQVYMTTGASSAIAISLAAITNPGDEIIVISPYFPEYVTWAGTCGCEVVAVPAEAGSFQLDVPAIEDAVTEKTSAVIINSPNNPVGVIYTREGLTALAEALARKEAELGRRIYLISDEPYREITYGMEVPYVPVLYRDTIVCSSYSKSLSLPGERIGYIYVSDLMDDAAEVSIAVAGAGRALGYICAPVLQQRVVARCIYEPSDVEAYATNRELLMRGLRELGYEFVVPDGAFYLWVRALEPDAEAFSERAKRFELLLVPSNTFGVTGWVRLSYCIARETIERSMPAFAALMDSYRE